MKAVFRVDASFEMGSGHTMRCLTLADGLKSRGHDCEFIVREQSGHLINLVSAKGYKVHTLPACKSGTPVHQPYAHSHWLPGGQEQDSNETLDVMETGGCDWLVVDHYGIGTDWERKLRSTCQRILVIDDLADREHDADVLLDQNIGRDASDYEHLVPGECLRLVGPHYALLRPEFAKWRETSLNRRGQIKALGQLLISLGGADKDNVTGEVLEALNASSIPDSVALTVVLGQQNPWLDKIRQQAALSRFEVTVKHGVNNMSELMSLADIAIGAAGSTSWERCCLGVPTVMLVLAKNQKAIAHGLQQAQASVLADVGNVASVIEEMKKNPMTLSHISANAAAMCDGKGVSRLIEVLEQHAER